MILRDLLTTYRTTLAWEQDQYFQCLREHITADNLISQIDWLYSRAKDLFAIGKTQYKYEFGIALCLAALAHICTLKANVDVDKNSALLLDRLIELRLLEKADKVVDIATPSTVDPLRLTLEQYLWPSPLSAAWAWDAVQQFYGTAVTSCQEEVIVLLFDDEGVPARLHVEAFPGIRTGITIFPDPRYMAFVQVKPNFHDAILTAVEYAWSNAEKDNHMPIEVRWRISRFDNERLAVLQDKSVGAAYALSLSKLLFDFTDSLPALL